MIFPATVSNVGHFNMLYVYTHTFGLRISIEEVKMGYCVPCSHRSLMIENQMNFPSE